MTSLAPDHFPLNFGVNFRLQSDISEIPTMEMPGNSSSAPLPHGVFGVVGDVGENGSTGPNVTEVFGDEDAEPIVGPRWQAVIIALYGLATVLALSGNAVVVWVLALGRRARTDISAFLINLALADLTMALFCLPFTFTEVLLQSWLFGALLCPLVRFAQTLSVSVSIYTLTTIGIDRYYAVCHPLHSRMTKSRGKVFIALIWAVSISISSVQLGISRLGKGKCLEVGWPSRGYQQSYTVALLLGTYLLPLLVLTLAYSSVAVRLWGRRTPWQRRPQPRAPPGALQAEGGVWGSANRGEELLKSKSVNRVRAEQEQIVHGHARRRETLPLRALQVIKMLSIIVLMFAVCWLPLNVFQALLEFGPSLLPHHPGSATALYFCSHFLAMSHSVWNPLVYGFYNDSFRADLRQLCSRLCSGVPCLDCPCERSDAADGDKSKAKKQKSSSMSMRSSLQGRKTLPLGSSVRTYLTVDTVPQQAAGNHHNQHAAPPARSVTGSSLETYT
ncbi:neuropeptide Y receptor type 5-like [Lethenteron reissneri]|uniref:neuropeptide Y receptor type 5-like n=1 Tax=Lethenteron reissneri TaxID=7753 RepID=UPI002AB6E8A6|nr:neuropeptide Y receptor type 5-like [Lethenteron reissneri]